MNHPTAGFLRLEKPKAPKAHRTPRRPRRPRRLQRPRSDGRLSSWGPKVLLKASSKNSTQAVKP